MLAPVNALDGSDGAPRADLPHSSDTGRQHDFGGVAGEFVGRAGERYCAIGNVDQMRAFFISVVSSSDHWLFVSSNGGLTAGRVSPEQALFPYDCVDAIHNSALHTGPRTMIRVHRPAGVVQWEPFNREHVGNYAISRKLYKSVLGHKLCFEEINHDLALRFRYTWATSDVHGLVRECALSNLGDDTLHIEMLDGLQNILPAGTPRETQARASNLVDAYKWSELDTDSGLAMYALYAGITDRAEPAESLKATIVYCLGLDQPTIALSSAQVEGFRSGQNLLTEPLKRGVRGAFLVGNSYDLPAGKCKRWSIVADVEQSQAQIITRRQALRDPEALQANIDASVAEGGDRLARIMASNDAMQCTAEEAVTTHHYANVLFNVMRGGYFHDQNIVDINDFLATLAHFNRPLHARHVNAIEALPSRLPYAQLLKAIEAVDDPQLIRLALEYLPITFGRRHGDPSRPWNHFAIRLKDDNGKPLLSYEGNWRDIFQNWEALAFSTPVFLESMIAKFVNATTVDGYNPYRITKQGIDWEIEDPDDPWSYIGYWGDHQIIYLLKLLEASRQFHPDKLQALLHAPWFSFANVPYKIRDFEALVANPKSTVDFDQNQADRIAKLETGLGADARLLLNDDQAVVQVTLLEKLLIPLLAKLGNLVIDGGIWMNTQRPEWNDANNALVGQGLSMVTLYYLRRYVCFLDTLLADDARDATLSSGVDQWLTETAAALASAEQCSGQRRTAAQRFEGLQALGRAAAKYRNQAHAGRSFGTRTTRPAETIRSMLADALTLVDASIASNRRDDGLYHAYNTVHFGGDTLHIDHLYPMLEGQVAVLSSGAVGAEGTLDILEAMYASDLFRPDQNSFLLYPDRTLPGLLDKNRVPEKQAANIRLIGRMLDDGNTRIIQRDADGCLRFSPGIVNAGALETALDQLAMHYGSDAAADRAPLLALYEHVFQHRSFTGRSGTMCGFSGLGRIYWPMVAKL
ncbi:hypothetical protein GYB61_07270, partial [bacterium]|nr:hypothetical protein [bacterium]